MNINVKKLNKEAKMPTRATDGSAGYDVYAVSEKLKMEITGPIVEYDTGLAFEIPKGYYLDVRPRSSVTTKTTLMLGNGCGVLDSDYRGPLKFQFRQINPAAGKKYKVGDRIGQIILKKYEDIEIVEVQELSETNRGDGGFGSTGE